MQSPSVPKLNKENPKKWFIYWNHNVPPELWEKYKPRKRIRIQVKDNMNRMEGEAREAYAQERLELWTYLLKNNLYNPFAKELNRKQDIVEVASEVHEAIEEQHQLTVEQLRKQTPVRQALALWIEARKKRTDNSNTVSTYRVTANWLTAYFEMIGKGALPVSELKRLDITEALDHRRKERNLNPTSFNNEIDYVQNFFKFLTREEYIDINPILGKIDKVRERKQKHKWYDPETKKLVKDKLIELDEMLVYRVMQFTYYILIRSKTELMKLQAKHIDRKLKRVHFPAELSKNGVEAFRTYPPEFDQVLDEMDFDSIPKSFYIFGSKGKPAPTKSHKDLFAERWKPVREALGLSDNYTIYGMKHTRIVHELMKKTDGYDISYMARHEDPRSTKAYMRDYDIDLTYVYGPEDLTF